MRTKALEIRDNATFIPVAAIELVATKDTPLRPSEQDRHEAQRYLLARAGLGLEGSYRVALIKLQTNEGRIDPHSWSSGFRTMPVAHAWIAEHWGELKDGDVVDVRFILGETTEPAVSERITEPLP